MSVVSIRKTAGNDYESIRASVRKAIEDCGGLSDIIKPGYKVLIKPNFVAVPDDRCSGGVTRWEVVKAVAERVREEGADAIITVPVMKTHDQTEVTLGLKNLKGLIADGQKKYFHSHGVVNGVIDIIQTVKPVLSVIDATFCQQGLGPIFGETVEMDLILAC